VPALGVNDMVLDGRKNPLVWKFEDGEYRFTFRLRKRPNTPVKSSDFIVSEKSGNCCR